MFTKSQDQGQHFSNFYGDNDLLIQFIMVELLHIYRFTFQIKAFLHDRSDSTNDIDSFLLPLTQMLTQLIGNLPQQEESALTRWTNGSLTRFKEYCERFSSNSSHQNKLHVRLHLAAHQAWLTAVHATELLNSLQTTTYKINTRKILPMPSIKRAFNTLQMRFNRVIRYIPKILKMYWDNENVILCLLRKKKQFTEIYGTDFLYKRFNWPIQMKELIALLAKRYLDRGFEAILPTIEQIQLELYDVH